MFDSKFLISLSSLNEKKHTHTQKSHTRLGPSWNSERNSSNEYKPGEILIATKHYQVIELERNIRHPDLYFISRSESAWSNEHNQLLSSFTYRVESVDVLDVYFV